VSNDDLRGIDSSTDESQPGDQQEPGRPSDRANLGTPVDPLIIAAVPDLVRPDPPPPTYDPVTMTFSDEKPPVPPAPAPVPGTTAASTDLGAAQARVDQLQAEIARVDSDPSAFHSEYRPELQQSLEEAHSDLAHAQEHAGQRPTPKPRQSPGSAGRGCIPQAILAILGVGIVAAIGVVLLNNHTDPPPGASASPTASACPIAAISLAVALDCSQATPGSSILIATAATESSGSPGIGDFAGRWTMVSGLDDPTGLDVSARWFNNPNIPNPPKITPQAASAFFDLDTAGAVTGGEYHAAIEVADPCDPELKADGDTATGSVDVKGVGTVSWTGILSEHQCNTNTGQLVWTETGDVHYFQIRIRGEAMIMCRSNVIDSMTECAVEYPRPVAQFERTSRP
jgi:hypothetical protein